jgi:hypothetical protein
MSRKFLSTLLLIVFLVAAAAAGPVPWLAARAQDDNGGSVWFDEGIDPEQWYQDHEIEHTWTPDYLDLATGDPNLLPEHGVYAWPFALDSIGWSMQSYQDYGGSPYFHHGMDMMKVNGTNVFNRSGGQVVNIENYRPGWNLYWEVAVLDPDGYIWQYHHIDELTIPQAIWDAFAAYQADPIIGGFIDPDTYIGDIIEWPVWSYGIQFNHIHLNILAAGGVFVNGFEFHTGLPDTDVPKSRPSACCKTAALPRQPHRRQLQPVCACPRPDPERRLLPAALGDHLFHGWRARANHLALRYPAGRSRSVRLPERLLRGPANLREL